MDASESKSGQDSPYLRPRSPAERPLDIDGGELGGAWVCRGAWRYAPLPQREVGNLALRRRSRISPRSGIFTPAAQRQSLQKIPLYPPLPKGEKTEALP